MECLCGFSKKDAEMRRKELLQGVSSPVLNYISMNAKELVMNNGALLPLMTILTHVKGNNLISYFS